MTLKSPPEVTSYLFQLAILALEIFPIPIRLAPYCLTS